MKKLVTILGARPQFIKASVVSLALQEQGKVKEIVVHTGQHYDANMSDVFFGELDMRKPDYHLGIKGGSHGEMTGQMLMEIEQVLIKERPDAVLVYGDTNSTLAGALAAAKLHIPIAHVEAGLRSFNRHMPEEINRIVTDRLSTWLFTPTETAGAHLLNEGLKPSDIRYVGDVMYDVALHFGQKAEAKEGVLTHLNLARKNYVLATIHRAENTDVLPRLEIIGDSLIELSHTIPVVWPLHPRTRATLTRLGWMEKIENAIKIIEPVGYLDMVQLEKSAALIATDSGGVQKEAFFHRVPCVTLRDETEWVELVDAGWNRLAPPHSSSHLTSSIIAAINSKGRDIHPYGTGDAARKIASHLAENLTI